MQSYCLYTLAADNSGIDDFEDFHALDDQSAIHLISERPRANVVEIWQGKRRVHRFKKSDGPALISSLRFPFGSGQT